jgi:Subtilase family
VRNLDPRGTDLLASVEQEIEIDRPRTARRNGRPVASESPFERQQGLEQALGREARLERDDAVQETGLVENPDGLGVAKGRDGDDGGPRQPVELGDGAAELLLPVTEVRAEAHEGARHRGTVTAGVRVWSLPRTTLAFLSALVLAGSPTAAASTGYLVQVQPGSAALARAAGATPVVASLRIWRADAPALAALRRAGAVQSVQPDRQLFEDAAPALGEPLAPTEWWRSVVGADAAPAAGPGKPVTIVDSGVDVTHPEFASRPNTTMMNDQSLLFDEDDHGTEVASVVGAPVNGIGIAGVYPEAVLRSWDASPFGFITTSSAVRGIVAAANGGPGVINISFGSQDTEPLIENAILYAVRRGSLVVASAGNDGLFGNALSYPASYPHVLTVAATSETGATATFSSRSADVDLAAPGDDITVAEPLSYDPSGFISARGTSFSAPMVAGAAAWVWTARPALDATQLFDVMRTSADDLAPTGYDPASGFGVLDVPHALAEAATPRDPLEPNDDVAQVKPRRLFAAGDPAVLKPHRHLTTIRARVDRHEDPRDIYRAYVPAGGGLLAQTAGGDVTLRIYRSGVKSVVSAQPAAARTSPGALTFRNDAAHGVYVYVDVLPASGVVRTVYTLRLRASARR